MKSLCTLGLALSAVIAMSAVAAPAAAQGRRARRSASPPGVGVSVTPAPASLSPYRYIFTLRPTDWSSAEVVADRRLLSFVVRPNGSRRRHTCRHPDAPRRVNEGRVRTLGAGGEPEWREWIDLRMYCWGRALSALSSGAEVEVHYGFRRARRGAWVAREATESEGPATRGARSLEGGQLTFAAIDEGDETATEGAEAPAVRVSMGTRDVRTGQSLTFRPRLRSTGRTVHVYVRDDLFRYRINGPLGQTECALPRTPIAPIVDFYRRLGRRGSAGGTLAIIYACRDAFQVAGIYEVTPIVDLIYDAAGWDLDDVATGTFEGEAVPIRVRRGERGYVEQVPGTEIAPDSRGDS